MKILHTHLWPGRRGEGAVEKWAKSEGTKGRSWLLQGEGAVLQWRQKDVWPVPFCVVGFSHSASELMGCDLAGKKVCCSQDRVGTAHHGGRRKESGFG